MTVRFRISRRLILRSGLLCIAIGGLGVYTYSIVSQLLYQSQAARRFDEVRNGDVQTPARLEGPKRRQRAGGSSVGRISVPRLHLSAMVAEGVGNDTLAWAVGHVPGTPLPGEPGNVAIAGHRDSFFRSLKDLRSNDEIVFTTLDGSFRYAVRELKIVEANNVSVLDPTPVNTLTLVTCFPFRYIGAAPKRYIVKAEEVGRPLNWSALPRNSVNVCAEESQSSR